MNRSVATVFGFAYLVGLASAAAFDFPSQHFSWQQWLGIFLIYGTTGVVIGLLLQRFWYRVFNRKLWLVAGLIAGLAVVYLSIRTPQPGVNDLSRKIASVEARSFNNSVTVKGKVISEPKLTRSGQVQLWLKVREFSNSDERSLLSQKASGKLYVTVPSLQGKDIYPGQKLAIAGSLYQPQSATNPGAFDFRKYLARQGAFAGLKGKRVFFEQAEKPAWGMYKLRSRIIDAQVDVLGSRKGLLLSSMVLGRKAVNLPYDLRDLFIEAGFAHILAASGFHVSLLLGVVLRLTKGFSARTQLLVGLITLIIYVGLTGMQPSVLRAALMGVGALIGIATERKVRRLGALFLVAILLLLINPLWLFDLGFQLSFLATLGLIVTLPALQKYLDWLPIAIATIVAIPIAASVWTFPLLIYNFNTVVSYSIPANIVSAPLVALISLGGMISALAALIVPAAGSAIALLLYYPIGLLIAIAEFFTSLPGSSLAVGKISLGMVLLIYALIYLVWQSQWWQRRWWLAGLSTLTLILVSTWYRHLNLVQVTVFDARQEPAVVIQDRGEVTLINSGNPDTLRYTVVPFLIQEGINRIDCAVYTKPDFSNSSSRSEIVARLNIKNYLTLQPTSLATEEKPSACSKALQLIDTKHSLLRLQVKDWTWLMVLGKTGHDEQFTSPLQLNSTRQVLLWSGKSLHSQWLNKIEPQIAIAATYTVEKDLRKRLRQKHIDLYITGRDGAIQWTPRGGFQATLAQEHDSALKS